MTYSSISRNTLLAAFLGTLVAVPACGHDDVASEGPEVTKGSASQTDDTSGAQAEAAEGRSASGDEASKGRKGVSPIAVPAGFVDEGFGKQGSVVFTEKDVLYSEVHGLAADARGAIFVAGRHNAAVVALESNGKLDKRFGQDGVAAFGSEDFYTTGFALQPDGKLVVGGLHTIVQGPGKDGEAPQTDPFDPNVGPYNQASFFRMGPDGALDPSFGTGGIAIVRLPEQAFVGVQAIAVQPDGKLLAAGEGGPADASEGGNMAVLRVQGDGTLDPSFAASGGFAFYNSAGNTDLLNDELALGVTPGPDGTIYVMGYGHNPAAPSDVEGGNPNEDFLLVRYLPNGQLDPSFGQGGVVFADALSGNEADPVRNYGYKAAVDAEGRVVLGGFSQSGASNDAMLVRYLPNGQLDPSFGTGGTAMFDFDGQGSIDTLNDLAILPDGSIVAVGATIPAVINGSGYGLVLVVGPDGAPSQTFGDGGVVRVTLRGDVLAGGAISKGDKGGASWLSLSKIAVQADGKFVVGGSAFGDEMGAFVLRFAAP